jgi:hypothetical protein
MLRQCADALYAARATDEFIFPLLPVRNDASNTHAAGLSPAIEAGEPPALQVDGWR